MCVCVCGEGWGGEENMVFVRDCDGEWNNGKWGKCGEGGGFEGGEKGGVVRVGGCSSFCSCRFGKGEVRVCFD